MPSTPPDDRCCFRTVRAQADGTHRCMNTGTTFVNHRGNPRSGFLVCTRHRALARRYTDLNMSWTYHRHREPLEDSRGADGRFRVDTDVSGSLIPPGSEVAMITLFSQQFLDEHPIDWHLAESGTTCPICLDEDTDSTHSHVRLQCGHGMHLHCMSQFVMSGTVDLSAADTVMCPLCRGDILPDIVQYRHHLLHKSVYKLGHTGSHHLRDLVLIGETDTGIDQEIKAFCIHPGPVKFVTTKNPTTVYNNWSDLNIQCMQDPTDEIFEMVARSTTPAPEPVPPEQLTPPRVINLVDSPPPTPRPDRRVRRRLDHSRDRHPLVYPPAHHVSLDRGQLSRAEEINNTTARAIGINLTEINLAMTHPDTHVFQTVGSSVTGNVRYSLTVMDVLVPGTGTAQRQLSLVIDDANSVI